MGVLVGLAAAIATAAVATPARAEPPAVKGTRNLSLAGAARSSSYGTNAALLNPSNMSFSQTFAIEPIYQLQLRNRQHGLGLVIMDSLNNPRVAIGLGYAFLRAKPEVEFVDAEGIEQDLEMSKFGHEVFVGISITAIKNWLSIGVKPKYVYQSLRFRDPMGVARNATGKLNSFDIDISTTVNFLGWAAVSVTGDNLVADYGPAFTDQSDVSLTGFELADDTQIDHGTLDEVSDYPRSLTHGLAVFPLRNPNFSLNFDGTYDFTTYEFEDHVRKTYGGSVEFVAGPVPLRFGSVWDERGRGRDDDRVFVAGGVAYVKPAADGGVGVDAGFGFLQQVDGPGTRKETVLTFNLGLRLRPDL